MFELKIKLTPYQIKLIHKALYNAFWESNESCDYFDSRGDHELADIKFKYAKSYETLITEFISSATDAGYILRL